MKNLFTPGFFRFLSGFVAIIFLALGVMLAINYFDLELEKERQVACPEGAGQC